jgi:hypothetical protein
MSIGVPDDAAPMFEIMLKDILPVLGLAYQGAADPG